MGQKIYKREMARTPACSFRRPAMLSTRPAEAASTKFTASGTMASACDDSESLSRGALALLSKLEGQRLSRAFHVGTIRTSSRLSLGSEEPISLRLSLNHDA